MTPSLAPNPEADSASPAPDQQSSAYRWLLPLLGVLSLLAACVLWSLKKQMIEDEVYTRTELSDPSLTHLMHAVVHLGGAGMPLFYLTAWPWAHLVGLGDLSLRLFSSIGMCAAFLLLIVALRHRFSARSAFLGVAFGMFCCLIVMDQNVEARAYGLYLLLFALGIAQWLRIAETPRPGVRDFALLALSQAGIVLGHVLGIFYAGLMLLALVVVDLRARHLRWRVYTVFIAGWLALLPWIPAIRSSMAIAKPHGWITAPSLAGVAIGLSYWLFAALYHPLLQAHSAWMILGWACAIFCVVGLVLGGIRALRLGDPAQRPAHVLGFALIAAPLFFAMVSYLASPIWVARYMIPSTLGIAILSVGWVESNPRIRGPLAGTLAVALLAMPVASALAARPDRIDIARIDRISNGQILVCDWLDDFMILTRYSVHREALRYPLDWQAALSGPPIAVGHYHYMQNYRREGYLAGNLEDASRLLDLASFLVLDDTNTNWFQLEIAANPHFTWKVVAQIDPQRRVIQVDRRP